MKLITAIMVVNDSEFKSRLRKYRESLKISRAEAARALGMTEKALYSVEVGKSQPKLEHVVAFARLYSKSLSVIVSDLGFDLSGIPDD